MDLCRGQGYDGAGNMTEKYCSAAKLIQNVHKSALYVHCFSHQLNLCVAAACKVMSIDKVMNSVRIVSDFFNSIPKRQQLLEKILEEKYGKESKLLNICRTRWAQRLYGLDRFEETIECVVKALEVMDRNEDRTWNSETHTTAGHLLSVNKSFEFIATLIIIQRVLSYTHIPDASQWNCRRLKWTLWRVILKSKWFAQQWKKFGRMLINITRNCTTE